MIQSISDLYKKHTILIKTFNPVSFSIVEFCTALTRANREGIKLSNMKLFVPERLCFSFGLTLGYQQNAVSVPSPYKTVSIGLIGRLSNVDIHTDIFSEDKLIEKENIELRGF